MAGRSKRALRDCVRGINRLLASHALGWDDLPAFLRHHHDAAGGGRRSRRQLRRRLRAAESVVRDHRVPADLEAFRALADELRFALDFAYDESIFAGPLAGLGRGLRRLFSVLLFVFCCYMVFGALVEGHSHLLGEHGLLAIAVFAALMLALGAFEGLQISITALRLKDLHALQERYPRAYALHRIFRSEEGTRKFLAGRQLFVVVLVFIAAQITSFPTLDHWPLTGAAFPGWLSPWFELVFLELGVLGALVVLWVGQLAPQFVANKYPALSLNVPGAGIALRLALLVESLGFTAPGEWLARWPRGEEAIPASPRESFRQALDEIDGYGALGVKRVWELSADGARLEHNCATAFVFPGFEQFIDDSLEVDGVDPRPRFHARLLAREPSRGERSVVAEGLAERRLADGRVRYRRSLSPAAGPFLPGDVLVSGAEVRFASCREDVVRIAKPTKYLLFRLHFAQVPDRLGPARVEVFKTDSSVANADPIEDFELAPRHDADGLPFFELFLSYPATNTRYRIRWDAGQDDGGGREVTPAGA